MAKFGELTTGEQLISPAARAVVSLDPASGRELWRVRYPEHSAATQPLFGPGPVYLSTGCGRAQLLAIRPDGEGNVTDTHVVWRAFKGIGRKPSPPLVDDLRPPDASRRHSAHRFPPLPHRQAALIAGPAPNAPRAARGGCEAPAPGRVREDRRQHRLRQPEPPAFAPPGRRGSAAPPLFAGRLRVSQRRGRAAAERGVQRRGPPQPADRSKIDVSSQSLATRYASQCRWPNRHRPVGVGSSRSRSPSRRCSSPRRFSPDPRPSRSSLPRPSSCSLSRFLRW